MSTSSISYILEIFSLSTPCIIVVSFLGEGKLDWRSAFKVVFYSEIDSFYLDLISVAGDYNTDYSNSSLTSFDKCAVEF